MDIHYLRHFLAVADELHFGRAAARMQMAQAPLSQSIKRLEAHLGAILFDRSAHGGTRLTQAGLGFRPSAELAVRAFDTAMAQARIQTGAAPLPVRVGFAALGLPDCLPRAVRALEVSHPGAQVRMEEGTVPGLLEAVASGRLQMALVHPAQDMRTGVPLTPLVRDRIVAALPAAHRLAGRRKVSLREMCADPLVFFPRPISAVMHDGILEAFRALGLEPRIQHEAVSIPAMLLLVAGGMGYALVPESARDLPFSSIGYVPVSDMPADLRFGLDLATAPEISDPAAQKLAELIRAMT